MRNPPRITIAGAPVRSNQPPTRIRLAPLCTRIKHPEVTQPVHGEVSPYRFLSGRQFRDRYLASAPRRKGYTRLVTRIRKLTTSSCGASGFRFDFELSPVVKFLLPFLQPPARTAWARFSRLAKKRNSASHRRGGLSPCAALTSLPWHYCSRRCNFSVRAGKRRP